MNKVELANKILAIEGLSNEDKSALLGLLREQKKYGLVWEDKPEDVEQRLETELPILREVKDRAIISDNPDAPNHILIEGDNLEALTTLAYTHAGKIDVIYIDPPYNTGNKDFVYNDSYVDSEDTYRHSKWLSFIHKRLSIAKELLSDRGVIFISIDDNEQANLKLLCDEIFGVANYITSIPRLTKKAGKTTNAIAVNHDYVLIYSKLKAFNLIEHNDPAFKHSDEYEPQRGKYKLSQTLDYDTLGYVNSLDYPIEIDGEIFYPGNVSEAEYKIRKETNPKDGYRWRWSKELFKFGYDNGFIVVKRSRNGVRIYTKTYKKATISKSNNSYFIEYKDRGVIFSSAQMMENDFSNDNARKELDAIFDDKAFSYPKPISLPKICVWLASNSTSTILDFFAGSGTTLHATMQLNAEDGGHRTCILVTNNENGICENVTYERNKRVIQGYTTPKGEEVAGLTDNNLRYYRTEFIPAKKTVANMRNLMELSTDMLCIKEDLYTEQPKIFGKTLRKEFARFFDNGKGKRMLIIYDERFVGAIIRLLATTSKDFQNEGKIKIYVYSMNGYAYKDEFMEVGDFVEPTALPAAIYEAYKKVARTKKATTVDAIAAEISAEAEAEEAERNLFNLDDEKGGNQ